MARYCVVLVSASSASEGRKIALTLLKEKLAACVNIVPKISSSYWWKGRIETASESLLVIKTRGSAVRGLINKVKKLHSYAVPEVIALPILDGNRDYLLWIDQSMEKRRR